MELLKNALINENSVFFAGNAILKLIFNSFRTIDLCRFTMMSLKRACEDFGCDVVKGSLTHEDVQNFYFKKGENFYKELKLNGILKIEDNKEKYIKAKDIIDYNILDCLSLADLYIKVRGAFIKLCNKDIDEFMTISQLAYNTWNETDHKTKAPKDLKTWEFFRSAVVAGRSQIFQTGHFKGAFQSWDVKSLYPYIMLNCVFPIGHEIETDKYIEGKLGIYYCKILKQPKDNIIPQRKTL